MMLLESHLVVVVVVVVCCAAAGVAIPIVSVLNAISVTNTDAAIIFDDEILRLLLLRLPSSSIS